MLYFLCILCIFYYTVRKERKMLMKSVINTQLYIKQNYLTDELFTEDSIFFDIETTGFSPTTSYVYLIGCLYRDGQNLIIHQFFAEHKSDEKDILLQFMDLLGRFKTIITFNGIGFDIPFIKAKCDTYSIEEHFKEYQYLDIFKLVGNIKFLLKQANYKQKTIESFLGIHRDDMFSGGELINVYEDYVHTHSAEAEKLLLLHNYEDVTGMLDLLPILTYNQILNGAYLITSVEVAPYTNYEGESCQEVIISLQNDYVVPKRVSYQQDDFYFTMNKETTKVRILIYEGELKYFYPNYKDYFYLPKEDLAIHKSVASFVDKQYRERAKASNCYTRKAGYFLPQCDIIMQPFFKKDYKDKFTYFELTEDFISSDIMLRRYVEHIFENALHRKKK